SLGDADGREIYSERRASARRRRCACRLELRCEEGLVDLALVDRDALLETEADHLLAIHVHLLRQLLWRQVVRHTATPLALGQGNKKSPAPEGGTGSKARLWTGRSIHRSAPWAAHS